MLLLALAACTPTTAPEGILAIDAIERHERGEIIVVDVRAAREVLAAFPKHALVHIQFGPDEWGAVAEEEARAFAEKLQAVMDGRPVALLCQYGVRSAAAAEALKRRGIAAQTITDGYLGNRQGPGWRAWE